MWLLPFLLVAGIALLASSNRRGVYALPPPRPVPWMRDAPSGTIVPVAGAPSPIAVLGEFVRAGARPPPPVILCALAEAEALGRRDIADGIVRTFVAPVVAAEVRRMSSHGAPMRRGSDDVKIMQHAPTSAPHPDDARIQAALNANPQQFVRDPSAAAMNDDAGDGGDDASAQASGSPIVGVDPAAWSQFRARLERETPLYESSRHVGRYRQRRDRLAELGIDPRSVIGDPDAQRDALDVDLADAHRHAAASGLAAEHVGRPIMLPGEERAQPITLSGVLGVIQAAGLEGACGWLESPADRRKFPHTTRAFLRTNGVF